TVQLVVGKNQAGEPIQIPDLACLTINEVKSRLAELSSITIFESYSGCNNAEDSLNAKVMSQTPEFIDGVLSPAGSTITILLQKNGCTD
ncbi:MAG: hypothetical protein ORN50_04285, partial [Crocinitomicaceae bacterium]|nr:hypothetical protein [Crocinitomicaceae bacterium]